MVKGPLGRTYVHRLITGVAGGRVVWFVRDRWFATRAAAVAFAREITGVQS